MDMTLHIGFAGITHQLGQSQQIDLVGKGGNLRSKFGAFHKAQALLAA